MAEEDENIESMVFEPKSPKEELANIKEKFDSAEDSRRYDEERWLNAYEI